MIVADELLVPSIPVWPVKGKNFSPWVIDFLQLNFLSKPDPDKFPEKIFISRQKAHLRNILNEEKVMELLAPNGYQLVFLEDYTVEQQAQLFSNAKIVIGAHGSALTNLVFCQPNTVVIEISPFDGHRGPFSELAKQKRLENKQLETNDDQLNDEQRVREDIYVDIERLLTILPRPVHP